MMLGRLWKFLVAMPGCAIVLFPAGRADAIPAPQSYGPTLYKSEAYSAFNTSAFGFCVEDFENLQLDVPGATGDGTPVGPGGQTDSVDQDDGVADNSGTDGRSYFSFGGPAGILINFDENRVHGLPTQVGIVWTDGSGKITFEAFGPEGATILGPNGPNDHADENFSGGTSEDRFYGVYSAEGISKIHIRNEAGTIEVDHLQLDRCILCGDATLDLRVTAPDALLALQASVGSQACRPCLCDVNDSSGTSASDALVILRESVGLSPPMSCPACPELLILD